MCRPYGHRSTWWYRTRAYPPAEAAKTPSPEAAALKEATTACKAEAKEKKISWPASRKFVSNCVAKTVKLTPAQLQEIAVKQAIVACKAEAKGKKIRWRASRKFVSTCLSNALKDYDLDVALLRRELNMAGLRRYTPRGNWMHAERLLWGTVKPLQFAGRGGLDTHVRFGSLADILRCPRHVRFTPETGD